MMETARYLVSQEIAERSGMIDSRYRVADGRYVLNENDLSRVRFTVDEYVNGLSGVEKVDKDVAKTLIAQNNYQIGRPAVVPETNETAEHKTDETENANTEEMGEQSNENGGGVENDDAEPEPETPTDEE